MHELVEALPLAPVQQQRQQAGDALLILHVSRFGRSAGMQAVLSHIATRNPIRFGQVFHAALWHHVPEAGLHQLAQLALTNYFLQLCFLIKAWHGAASCVCMVVSRQAAGMLLPYPVRTQVSQLGRTSGWATTVR